MKLVLLKTVLQTVSVVVISLVLGIVQSGTVKAETIVRKHISYFKISGKTASDLDKQLATRGPKVSGMERHPGATQIKFSGTLTYRDTGRECSISKAKVLVNIGIILPHWTDRRKAPHNLTFLWDTLSSDMRRHEERHAEIAVIHARALEKRLLKLAPKSNCKDLAAKASETTDNEIALHDADQQRFDRSEAINFEARMTRLLQYRIQQARKD